MPYARRTFRGRSSMRRTRRWQWVRQSRNSVTAITDTNFQTIDLLDNLRTQVGIDLNFPEFTIWRVRIKVSVRFTPVLTTSHVDSNSGVCVAMFADASPVIVPATTYPNPTVSQYTERYLLWDFLYATKTIAASTGVLNFASAEDIALYQEFDMKGRRKLPNIGDSLIFQIAANGGTIQNYSLTQQTLLLMGH